MSNFFKATLGILFISLISCENDDDVTTPPLPEGEFTEGFFVLNEGGIGSVSFISNDFSRVEQQIYSNVNNDDDIGQFVQSMFFDENDRAYIISNGSNLITVVNRFTFEKVGEITNSLDVPRYGAVINGKAYVTNQASFTTNADDFVTVIDLESLEVDTTIPFNTIVENIITDGNKLYVQNAAFGTGSGITVIDPASNSIEEEIQTGDALQSIFINANSLFALHGSGMDRINMNTQEVSLTLDLPSEISGANNLKIFNGVFYYTFANNVYKTPLSESSLSSEPFISYESNSQFGTMYGFAVNNGLVYISDATDFASDGFVEIYDLDGILVFETSVGIGPNGFYFN